MNPGGNVSAIVYSKFLDKMGMPQAQGVDLTPYFTKEFYQGRIPVWQDADDLATLGAVETDPGVGIDPASVKKPKSNAPASTPAQRVYQRYLRRFFAWPVTGCRGLPSPGKLGIGGENGSARRLIG